MRRGPWRPLVLLVLGLLLVGVVVVRLGGSSDDGDLEARLDGAESEVEGLRKQVAGLERVAAMRDVELAEAGAPFSSEFLAAIEQVQHEVAEGVCASGRSAAREGQPVPAADDVVRLVASGEVAVHPVLVPVEGWISLLDVEAADAEARRCHDEEMQLIDEEERVAEEARLAAEAEARAAEEAEEAQRSGEEAETETPEPSDSEPPPPAAHPCDEFLREVQSAGRPPTSGEVQYLWFECGIDYRG